MPVEQPNDPFEDRFSAALRQAGGTFDTDRAALVAAGQAYGRRLRLRRRRAVVAGGAAGLALVGVGGALLAPSEGSASEKQRTSVAAKRSDEPGSVSADEMIRTLEKLLPEGEISGVQGRGTDDPLPPYAYVVFDDGKGAGAISLSVDRIARGTETVDPTREVMPCPDPDSPMSSLDHCVTETLPDGSVVTLFQGYEYPDRRAETKAWGADLVTPAGQRVSVSEWNAAAQKGEPVSRPEPPLSLDRLKTLAAAKEWRRVAHAIPKPSRQPAPSTPRGTEGVGGRRILGLLTAALPDGLKVVSRGAQDPDFAYVVVDDGKGRSYVQINVQAGMSDAADQLYGADSETLADGTRVATRQGPGEKGGEGVVMWTVDTMREDGKRVVVSAFNSGRQDTAATREEPALSMAQLRKIALSPQWLVIEGG
ncbi:hypothetical protein ACIBBD_13865 [Streptomyces sp. NPDC051315]|uniref:hypothetical protein n=1 Tax=Streptomyces sp. NPDC051315 TaxID=3365650 RepID=UPI00378CA089